MIVPFKNRKIDIHFPVSIYRNLRKKGFVLSVKQFGKVVAHTDKIILKNCKMIVRQSARLEVIKKKQKNIHAFIEGYITDDIKGSFSYELKYNPYRNDSFYSDLIGNIKQAERLYIQNSKVMVQL